MGSQLPKQFMTVHGRPVLYYTLKIFLQAFEDLQIILVLPADYSDMGKQIIDNWFGQKRIRITAGGKTRFQSVKNGLQFVEKDSIVFIHDGVRCLLSEKLIHRCYELALKTGTAIPVIASRDSVRLINDEGNVAIDRNKVMLVQTPQTFQSNILLPAFQIDYEEKFTDEATVVEASGTKISLVEGEENNIKITRPIDLLFAEKILNEEMIS